MTFFKHIMAVSAVTLGLGAGAAQAVTFDNITAGQEFEFTFSWNDTPYSEEHLTGIAYDFDLSIASYSGTGSQQTGYYVDQILGGVSTRLTTSTDACDDAVWGSAGRCDLVTASTPDGTLLFAGLSAGTYEFGVYDSATPQSGSLTFNVSKVSPVPLPAAGLLLLGALGGVAAMRKRKNAA